jgi:hypothetical protein
MKTIELDSTKIARKAIITEILYEESFRAFNEDSMRTMLKYPLNYTHL